MYIGTWARTGNPSRTRMSCCRCARLARRASARRCASGTARRCCRNGAWPGPIMRSEEHTSELQSLMRISYAVFCLKKKNKHEHSAQKPLYNENNIQTKLYCPNTSYVQ